MMWQEYSFFLHCGFYGSYKFSILCYKAFKGWQFCRHLTESECDSAGQQTSHVASFQAQWIPWCLTASHRVMCGNVVLPMGEIPCITWWDTTFVTGVVIISMYQSIQKIKQWGNHIRFLSILGHVPTETTVGLFSSTKIHFWRLTLRK